MSAARLFSFSDASQKRPAPRRFCEASLTTSSDRQHRDHRLALAEAGQIDYKYEPSRWELLNHLLPLYVETQIYRAILESIASEFGARMTSMDNATSNATEMISLLTLQFNRARQAAITKELMEIVGGAEALAAS